MSTHDQHSPSPESQDTSSRPAWRWMVSSTALTLQHAVTPGTRTIHHVALRVWTPEELLREVERVESMVLGRPIDRSNILHLLDDSGWAWREVWVAENSGHTLLLCNGAKSNPASGVCVDHLSPSDILVAVRAMENTFLGRPADRGDILHLLPPTTSEPTEPEKTAPEPEPTNRFRITFKDGRQVKVDSSVKTVREFCAVPGFPDSWAIGTPHSYCDDHIAFDWQHVVLVEMMGDAEAKLMGAAVDDRSVDASLQRSAFRVIVEESEMPLLKSEIDHIASEEMMDAAARALTESYCVEGEVKE